MGRNSAFLKLHEVQSPTKTSHTEPLISNNEKDKEMNDAEKIKKNGCCSNFIVKHWFSLILVCSMIWLELKHYKV